jgi:hypothetical protein
LITGNSASRFAHERKPAAGRPGMAAAAYLIKLQVEVGV